MMSHPLDTPVRSASPMRIGRHRGLITAIVAFIALFMVVSGLSAVPLGYYDVSQMATSGATLAIVAMGQTLVVISGGFDLSAAAVVSLVNVVLASLPPPLGTSPLMMTLIGIGIGMLVGAFNGFFIAFLRLQAIVVTLSTMFILQGISLIVMDKPGGMIDASLSEFLLGDLIADWVPMSVALIVVLLAFWYWLKRTKLGLAIYASGGDFESAQSAGIPTQLTQFTVYVIAGGFYGLAGVFISAQTGAGDPLVGNPMLLQMFAAIVVGGTLLGGGRGGLTGSVLGAYVLMIIVNILLVLNVSAYYSTVAESSILLLAVLSSSLHRKSTLARNIRQLTLRMAAWRQGILPSQVQLSPRRLVLPGVAADPVQSRPTTGTAGYFTRHADIIRYALPAYVCFIGVLVVTQYVLGNTLLSLNYYNSLIVLASFLAILALGQGTVILTGGLDLSVPWTIGLCGILLAGMVSGSNVALIYAIPTVLALGLLIGFVNGLGIVALGLSPIVMTLAVNGILQGVALVYSGGTPDGFASPLLRSFMTSRFAGITPVVPFIFLFVAFAILLLGRTAFGRRVYAIGNSERAAELSGVPVRATTIKGLHAVRLLRGARRHLVDRVLRSGKPRNGRRVSVAIHRSRCRRWCADHGRTWLLCRHAWRRHPSHRLADAACGHGHTKLGAVDPVRAGHPWCNHRTARPQKLTDAQCASNDTDYRNARRTMMSRIAIIGTGFIGRAWAISFARSGHDVLLWDQAAEAPRAARDYIAGILPDLDANGLLNGHAQEAVLKRIQPTGSIDAALDGVVHVQENTPENLEIKIGVFSMLDEKAPKDAVIASSTSALLPSAFTAHVAGRHRCLVVHPINPPYLVPAAEVVPAPWTSPETIDRTVALFRSIGQAPLVMKREIDGFIMNRLQGALLEEAFRLVDDGYASVEDIDTGIRDGLALRWSFMGPFETIDLNAPAGIRDYVVRYESIYSGLWPSTQHRAAWNGPVLDQIEAERRRLVAADKLEKRQEWRDRRLMALLAHKRDAARKIGS